MSSPHDVRRRAGTGLALCLVLTMTACGTGFTGDGSKASGPSGSRTPVSTPTGTSTSAASVLRATFTDQLTSHVYLAGIAMSIAVSTAADSPAATSARAALDENATGLGRTLGSVYGQAAGDRFAALWRAHDGMVADYTVGRAGGDRARANKARADLDRHRNELGAFIASVNPNLPRQAVADELAPHVEGLLDTIDRVVAKDAGAHEALRQTAGHLPRIAQVLAAGIDMHRNLDGDTDAAPAELRAGLTHLLDEHVYLTGIVVSTAATTSPDSMSTAEVLAAWDDNTRELAQTIGSASGEGASAELLELWRTRNRTVLDYTAARASENRNQATRARAALDRSGTDIGAALQVPGVLEPHTGRLVTAIDRLVARDPGGYEAVRVAAGDMPRLAEMLAGGIARQALGSS